MILTPSVRPQRSPRGVTIEMERNGVAARLRSEPQIRAELFAVYGAKLRNILASEGLIPHKNCASGEFVCVWCDLVVSAFRPEELDDYRSIHDEFGCCFRPEQVDTPSSDALLKELRSENAFDHANFELTTKEKMTKVKNRRINRIRSEFECDCCDCGCLGLM